MSTYQRGGTDSEDDLFPPGTAETDKNVLLGDVLDSGLGVILGIVAEDDALDLVGGAAKPALLDVAEDGLEAGLGAGDVGGVANGDAEGAAEDAAEVGGGVSELVLFAVALVELDEDAEVVLAGEDLNRGAGELGGDLVKAAGADAALGAGDVEGADGRVVRGLLGQVGDGEGLGVVGGAVLRRGEGDGGGVLVALDRRLGRGGALASEPGGEDLGRIVFGFPVALEVWLADAAGTKRSGSSPLAAKTRGREEETGIAHPEELAQARVIRLAGLALGIFQILGQPEADDLEHAVEGLVGAADGDKGIGSVEVGPVFEVGRGLEQLGGEGESDGGEVRDADEPAGEDGQLGAHWLASSLRSSGIGLRALGIWLLAFGSCC